MSVWITVQFVLLPTNTELYFTNDNCSNETVIPKLIKYHIYQVTATFQITQWKMKYKCYPNKKSLLPNIKL